MTMKNHDHHVMLQYILPACIRNILMPNPCGFVIWLGKCFQKIHVKIMDRSDIPSLKVYVAKTLSLFEMWFLVGFFDIMTHLLIHLVDDLDICGLVVTRWCYLVERYLGVWNNMCRTKPNWKVAWQWGTCMLKLWDFVYNAFNYISIHGRECGI
jgi:hypothetical protein